MYKKTRFVWQKKIKLLAIKANLWDFYFFTHTHTHTHKYIYINIYILRLIFKLDFKADIGLLVSKRFTHIISEGYKCEQILTWTKIEVSYRRICDMCKASMAAVVLVNGIMI